MHYPFFACQQFHWLGTKSSVPLQQKNPMILTTIVSSYFGNLGNDGMGQVMDK
jgi:hypothetical protein